MKVVPWAFGAGNAAKSHGVTFLVLPKSPCNGQDHWSHPGHLSEQMENGGLEKGGSLVVI